MASLDHMEINDEYYTSRSTWELIINYIPEETIVLEPFKGYGGSIESLIELGLNVMTSDYEDAYDQIQETDEYDMILTNPPWNSNSLKRFLNVLKEVDKPFILILPITKICSKYFKDCFQDIQIIIPRSRISFINIDNKKQPSFPSVFVCYKMYLEKDIIYL